MRPRAWMRIYRKLRMRFQLVAGATRLKMPLSLSESGVPPARFTCVFVLSGHAPQAPRAVMRSGVPLARMIPYIAVRCGTLGSVVENEAHGTGNKWKLLALACSSALTGISAA